ncbi:PREDICTED: uncharacterized protein LOC105961918 [Erythranthe guttata]|uniref:uncharacterized protein LOC105961918 n=1 Tax=Erythranthe guttata TaxID=4155 RepID=UPI00064DF178|nr:PREDICTED: uncharacterized protein LOC105961918 [Erythranthe guttata]|eukprot:XP_012841633.1 PREDICTED: uncharacterized protein LOC105961918 [Erythranthe guttata]
MGASSSFFKADKARMTRPVNGLICIYGMPLVCGVALCNPSLGGEMEFIPSCPISDPTFKGMIVRNIALGVDSTTKDVKIVQLLSYFQFRDDVATVAAQADVYTRRTRAWRRLEGGDVPDAFLRRCTVYGGEGGSSFAHWLHRGGDLLISFHMDDEVFSRTLLPETFNHQLFKTKVFPRGGSDGSSLVLLACPRLVQKEGLFQRWELVGGLGSQGRWTRLLSVDIGPTPMWATGSLLLMNKDEDFFYEYYSSHDYSNQEEEIIGDEVARRRRRTRCRYLKLVKYKGSLAF